MHPFDFRAPVTVFDAHSFEHEQLVLCQDPASGLKAAIAIHSTALGPALGGTRFRAYACDEAAIADVLDLARGMSYKNAIAGLDFGGGKAVILGDPAQAKSEDLLLAFGGFVAALGGRYTTGCDVGTDASDMDVVARVCPWTVGRSREPDGVGNTASFTAFGVLQGMRAAACHRWGTTSLEGRKVGVAGVGKVGRLLVRHLACEGARVVVTDVLAEPVRRVVEESPRVAVVDDTDTLIRLADLDIYAPCALGGALNEAVAPVITAEVVCGAANNQLTHPDVEQQLADRGTLCVPDYVVNAGGVIHAAGELRGHSPRQITSKVEQIFDTTLAVLERAESEGVLPGVAAHLIAEQRIAAAAGNRLSEQVS